LKSNTFKLLPAYFLTFVNVLGFSILIPVLPFVVQRYGAPEFVYGLLLSFYAFFQFIGSPFLGKLSDSMGRKPILIVSQIGTLLSWFIFALAYFLPETKILYLALPLWVIAFGRIIDGITGGNVSVANAYISDITSPAEKVTIFGYMGGIVGIAMIIGPGIGGVTSSGSIGYLGTVLVAIFISTITVLSIFMYLKESLPKEKRRKRESFSLKSTFLILRRVRALQPNKLIKQVLVLKVFVSGIMAFYISTMVLYIIDNFGFNEKEVGGFMLVAGIFLAFNQAFLYKRIVYKIGELGTLKLGFALMTVGFIAITITKNPFVFTALYFVLNMGISISMPVFNSIISQNAEENKVGELMGISESISSMSNAIFPVIAAFIYGLVYAKLFWLLSFFAFVGMLVAIFTIRKNKA